jgi:hypothetical protein
MSNVLPSPPILQETKNSTSALESSFKSIENELGVQDADAVMELIVVS